MSREVDAFIRSKVLPEHREIVSAIRKLVSLVAPEVEEGMRGGTEKYIPVPVFRLKRDIIVLSPSTKGITVSFAKGARFDDPFGRLGGAGKTSRTMRIRTMKEFDKAALTSYIQQAVRCDLQD